MARSFSEDYEDLKCFVSGYGLRELTNGSYEQAVVKPLHKKYYSALVIIAEINHRNAEPSMLFVGSKKDEQLEIYWNHLSESISELGSSFFLLLNGCYKAASQVLRSSIENFVKANGCLFFDDIHRLKNVYEVFDKSKTTGFFSSNVGSAIFDDLHRTYGNLCSSVHTASKKEMQSISALSDFPAFDLEKAKEFGKKYSLVVSLYVSSLSIVYRDIYHKMYHDNQDLVSSALLPSVRNELYGSNL